MVAVTKTHPPAAIRAGLAAGLTVFGENRVQEALRKMDALAGLPVEWHLIGTLQRNKVRLIPGRFALLHAVDRAELVEELARRLPSDPPQRLLLEVNCSGESQKAGIRPADLPGLLAAVRRHRHLVVDGLMTMAPFTADEGAQRRVFRRLRELRDAAAAGGADLPILSMGMSNDYAIAVEEGATMVRLGTVFFGERSQ